MGLFLQIVVFLIIAAALGFAVGWLVRGAGLVAPATGLDADWRPGPATAAVGRARAGTAGAGGGAPAAVRASASDRGERAARSAQLEAELASARQANARHQAETERLAARIAELEASPPGAADKTAGAAPGAPEPPGAAVAAAGVPGTPPPALARPEGEPDDLQQISGIGPGIERTLHRLGIFHFRQIAAFTPDNVRWVNQRLRFRGRIEREDWIGQARRLATGGDGEPLQ